MDCKRPVGIDCNPAAHCLPVKLIYGSRGPKLFRRRPCCKLVGRLGRMACDLRDELFLWTGHIPHAHTYDSRRTEDCRHRPDTSVEVAHQLHTADGLVLRYGCLASKLHIYRQPHHLWRHAWTESARIPQGAHRHSRHHDCHPRICCCLHALPKWRNHSHRAQDLRRGPT